MSVRVARREAPAAEAAGTELEVRGLRIAAKTGAGERTIVSRVDLDIAPGETVGIVGESGSGKSMTMKAIAGLLDPGVTAHGAIRYGGRDLLQLSDRQMRAMRGAEIGMILQDPYTMLNPLRRCGAHIWERLRGPDGHRLDRRQREAAATARLAEVGIRDAGVVHAYPFQLSGGMRQRVAIAAALTRDPQLLIADEPSTALDVTTQREILALIRRIQTERGMSLALITHDLRVAFAMCDRVYVLYAGRVCEVGDAGALENEPLHPYTLGLLLSEPPHDRRLARLAAIPGSVATADEVVGRCPFAPRCRWRQPRCEEGDPPLRELTPRRWSACVRVEEVADELTRERGVARAAVATRGEHEAPGLLEIEGVHKVFLTRTRRGREREVVAADDLSLQLRAGESVGIVGQSGSGKSTLARCIVGLEKPSAGRIVLDGVDVSDYARLDQHARDKVRATVQMVFQDPYSTLNPARTVDWSLSEALRAHGTARSALQSEVGRLLEQVGLSAQYADRRPQRLSGGERQRVAIARALAARPRLLVCDEPVSALDVSVQAQVLNLFAALRSELGLAYLFITHDLAVVRQVVDRVYVMESGRIVERGAVDDVLDQPTHPYTAALVDAIPKSTSRWLDQ